MRLWQSRSCAIAARVRRGLATRCAVEESLVFARGFILTPKRVERLRDEEGKCAIRFAAAFGSAKLREGIGEILIAREFEGEKFSYMSIILKAERGAEFANRFVSAIFHKRVDCAR